MYNSKNTLISPPPKISLSATLPEPLSPLNRRFMLYSLDDTIVARASAPAFTGLRGILRLSGSDTFQALESLGVPVHTHLRREFAARFAESRLEDWSAVRFPAFRFRHTIRLEDPHFPDSPLPVEIAVFCWSHAASYTGQPCAEIHTHGCLPLLERLSEALCATQIARLAQPGEFTMRAFLSGRIDLTQAEAVLGTIQATTDEKLNVALAQMAGGLATTLHEVRAALFDLLGHLEARFDFAEEDISFVATEEITQQLAHTLETLRDSASAMKTREKVDGQVRVVLCGRANIGKSSLFNALLRVEGAVVYDAPGTTRDYLSAPWTPGPPGPAPGPACLLIDTAGEENLTPEGTLTHQAEAFARQQKTTADIRISCCDAQAVWAEGSLPQEVETLRVPGLTVLTRCDLLSERQWEAPFWRKILSQEDVLPVSVRKGHGLTALETRIRWLAENLHEGDSRVVAATAERCRDVMRLALDCVERALTLADSPYQELLAAEIRAALDALGLIVGATYTEDILDSIFSRFCVGK